MHQSERATSVAVSLASLSMSAQHVVKAHRGDQPPLALYRRDESKAGGM